jgi:hypothetical protein
MPTLPLAGVAMVFSAPSLRADGGIDLAAHIWRKWSSAPATAGDASVALLPSALRMSPPAAQISGRKVNTLLPAVLPGK